VEKATADVRGGGGVEQRAEAAAWTKGMKSGRLGVINFTAKAGINCYLADPGAY
jgi:hypothetical protein